MPEQARIEIWRGEAAAPACSGGLGVLPGGQQHVIDLRLTARDLGGEVTPHREALMSVRIAVIAVTFLSLVGQAAAQDEPQDPVLEHLRNEGVREEAREKAGCTGDDSIAMVHCFALFNNCEQIGLIVEDLPASASEIGLTRERPRCRRRR